MKLLPLDKPELLELVARRLADNQNSQWLDFEDGRQIDTPALLTVMMRRDTHCLRVYMSDTDDTPVRHLGP